MTLNRNLFFSRNTILLIDIFIYSHAICEEGHYINKIKYTYNRNAKTIKSYVERIYDEDIII